MTNGVETVATSTASEGGSTRKDAKRGLRKQSRATPGVEAAPAHAGTSPVEPAAPERDDQLLGSIESVLLSVDRPVSALRLAEALGMIDSPENAKAEDMDQPLGEETPARGADKRSPMAIIKQAVSLLNSEYEATNRAFRIEAVAGGYRFMTLAHFAPVIEEFLGKRERTALSRPAVESLAIIAYKQPITRAQLEAVRGVACGEVLKTLVERRLVAITGRAEELGRPMLYGTTRAFLEAFGLSSLRDLPSIEEFRSRHAGGESE